MEQKSRTSSAVQYDMGAVIISDGVISNLDYHRNGRLLLMTTNESSIHMIDAMAGEEKKKLYAKANGIGKAVFTHHESCVLITSKGTANNVSNARSNISSNSNAINNDVKYLCLYDNRYIRYFSGAHQDTVTSLSMSPVSDQFITASNDRTVCMWDLSSPKHVGKLLLPNYCDSPSAEFDESGVVFGVMCKDNKSRRHALKLFDARKYETGPFQDIIPENQLISGALMKADSDFSETTPISTAQSTYSQKLFDMKWDSFKFSSDGNHILVNTLGENLLIFDGFRPDIEPIVITKRKNDLNLALGACFSADSKHVITANEDNEVLLYSKLDGALESTLTGHVAPVGCIASNPLYDQFATGCVNTALWLPSQQ